MGNGCGHAEVEDVSRMMAWKLARVRYGVRSSTFKTGLILSF